MTTRVPRVLTVILIAVMLLMGLDTTRAGEGPLARDLELEALQEAVRWPNADVQTVVALMGRFLASRRDDEARTYFRELAQSQPDRPLFLALDGLFQARTAGEVSLFHRTGWVNEAVSKLDRAVARDPGLSRYIRGLVLAELPRSFGKAEVAVADLEWVLQNEEKFPTGLRRGVYRALARAYTTLGREGAAKAALDRSKYPSLDPALPLFTTDFTVTARDGFRFGPPRLRELAPRVYVAQGYDFADIAFILTDDGVVAIDTGTSEANARAALAAFRRVSAAPISHVIVTHAHWDHVGGLAALTAPGTQVIANARYAEELRIMNETGVPFRYFFGSEGRRRYDLSPHRIVTSRETLTVGGTDMVLHPVRSGETDDALFIHLPARGVLFVGDAFMPYLGAPFLAEGSPEALFETIGLIRTLNPRVLIHGHPPLTEIFSAESLPTLEPALRELYQRTLAGIAEGQTLSTILQQNVLPRSLRDDPGGVLRFLVMRENFVKRIYHQRTGYWKPDGEGIEVLTPSEWAAALDLLGGRQEEAFVRATRTLLRRGDDVLALKLAEAGLRNYSSSQALTEARRQALDGLRTRNQILSPFKFIIYSEWAGADLSPVE